MLTISKNMGAKRIGSSTTRTKSSTTDDLNRISFPPNRIFLTYSHESLVNRLNEPLLGDWKIQYEEEDSFLAIIKMQY